MAIGRIDGQDAVVPQPAPARHLRIIRPHTSPRRRSITPYPTAAACADFTLAFSALFYSARLLALASPTLVALLGAAVLSASIALHRGYRKSTLASKTPESIVLARAAAAWGLMIVATLYFLEFSLPARSLGLVLVTVAASIQLVRVPLRLLFRRAWESGRLLRNAIIVGEYSRAVQLAEALASGRGSDLNVVGVCSPNVGMENGPPLLGGLAKIPSVVEQTDAEVIIIAGDCMSPPELRRLCWSLERFGVELLVAPNLEAVALDRIELHAAGDTPLLGISLQSTRAETILKAAVDRVLGGLLLLAASVPLLLLCLTVRFTSPGPVFFMQKRIGRNGEPFRMFKLRSMYVDAEERRAKLLARSDGNVVMFKMRNDPRVTPIGRVLRRFSLDELPQLMNVVLGEMSLVGPRPPLPEEVQNYCSDAHRRLNVKPGLTGLWQVNGRSDLDWDETIRYDLQYVDNWSLPMDLNILARTFRAVFGGRGAY